MGEGALRTEPDTFPKLLARNAREHGSLPAYREKEYGIWQSWTWAETEAEVMALAAGLAGLGLEPGDHLAIIGRNRPALYWAMVAAQACGAVPVPLYQDAVAEEMAYVLEHCGARFVVAGDQEQVDKVLEISDRLPALERIVYLDPRGLRNYDHARLHRYAGVAGAGRGAGAAARAAAPGAHRAGRARTTPASCSTPPAPPGRPKGVVLSNRNIIETAQASAAFDRLSARGQRARLPADGLGRRLHLLDGPGLVRAASASPARRAPRRCSTTCARSGRPTSSRRRGSSRGC